MTAALEAPAGTVYSVFVPSIAGVLVWGGPFLLEFRVRVLIPFRRTEFPLLQQPPKMEATL